MKAYQIKFPNGSTLEFATRDVADKYCREFNSGMTIYRYSVKEIELIEE